MPAEQVLQWLADWQPPQRWRKVRTLSKTLMPLLLAEAEHHAWYQALHAYLAGQTDQPPILETTECRVHRWLQSSRLQEIFADYPEWVSLHEHHNALHVAAQQLLKQSARNQPVASSGLLNEINQITEVLSRILKQLRRL